MWYKYVDRANYDPIRIFRYHSVHPDAATSDSMLMRQACSKLKDQESFSNISHEPAEARDPYIFIYTATRLTDVYLCRLP